MGDLTEEVLESRRATNAKLKESGDTWNYDNLGLHEYNGYFQPYIGQSIVELRDSIMKRKGKVKIANIMGGTKILRELDAKEGYALRLEDNRSKKTKRADREKRIVLATGNITSKKTLKDIPNDIDILLCMPAGAWEFLPMSRDFFYLLGSTAVEKLAVGGTALIQLPLIADEWMQGYVKRAENVPGLELNYHGKDSAGVQTILIIHKTKPGVQLPVVTEGPVQ